MDHDNHEEDGGPMHRHMMMGGPMRKEFKLAFLDKKEKILKAKLEFVGRMKELVKKMPDEKKT